MSKQLLIKSLILLMYFGASNVISAQEVSGVVIDGDTSEPLPGVSVLIKGTSTGTSTDFNGNYSLNVAIGDVLVFSYVGYADRELPAAANMMVTLQESAESLEEVVLFGYGQTTIGRNISIVIKYININACILKNLARIGSNRYIQRDIWLAVILITGDDN